MFNYPLRTRRNFSIAGAKSDPVQNPTECFVAGRIIGILDDGFVLQDESGRLDVKWDLPVRVGDIIEVLIETQSFIIEGKTIFYFQGIDMKVLAPCFSDFFIRRNDPNYLQIIVDLHRKERFVQRVYLLRFIRAFFEKRGFLEMDTPELVKLPGMEPYLDVFKTEFVPHNSGNNTSFQSAQPMYLITSPEYALKKLLTAGFEKIFQIAKSFRNKETASQLHNPEFTLLEWYRAYASYEEIMQDAEQFVYELAVFRYGNQWLSYKGHKIDTTPPWPRLKVKDAFLQYAGIAASDFEDEKKFRSCVQKKGYNVEYNTSFDDLFFMVFLNEIEPKLGLEKPVFLYEYPVSMAALSKKCFEDARYAERVEVYIAGIELANGFTELNDPVEQEQRLQEECLQRQKLQKDYYPVDQSFIRALQFGMPPSGGIALGVDRLMMILMETEDIHDVILFPFEDL